MLLTKRKGVAKKNVCILRKELINDLRKEIKVSIHRVIGNFFTSSEIFDLPVKPEKIVFIFSQITAFMPSLVKKVKNEIMIVEIHHLAVSSYESA